MNTIPGRGPRPAREPFHARMVVAGQDGSPTAASWPFIVAVGRLCKAAGRCGGGQSVIAPPGTRTFVYHW